ncbi:MAG: IMPACT family protein [Oscillospiraceae bacterium]|nr:IMPACT family protein [Oscillospiraceae bacterium]
MPSYRSVAKRGGDEFVEKGSRFIGVCAPVSGEEEAKAFVASVRGEHPGASHNVYAYRLRDGVCRYSDDGEPSGTAGAPAFEVLARREVVNAAVVITRYFGGTLLGAGGLVRAYAKASAMALDAAEVVEMRPWRAGAVAVPYALYEQAARLLGATGAKDITPDFGADVTVLFTLPEEDWGAMAEALRELTAGGAEPVRLRDFYA